MINKVKNFSRIFIKGILKTVFYAGLLLLILLTVIVIGFRTVYVQEKTGEFIGTELTKTLRHTVNVERVEIDWFDHIILKEVSIYDNKDTMMIHLGEGLVDFKIFTFEKKFTLRLEDIILKDGEVHLIKHPKSDVLNLTEFISVVKELAGQKDTVNIKKKKPFTLESVRLINMRFAYDDMNKGLIEEGFDHNHFLFDSIYGSTTNLFVYADTFRINIADLKSIEDHTKLRIHKLAGEYTLTKKFMELDGMNANIGNSYLADYIKFSYNDIADLSSFNTKANIKVNLDSSFLDFRDIAVFAPALKKYPYSVTISGRANGTVSRFTADKLRVYAGSSSSLFGSVHMEGLPSFFSTYIDATLTNIHIDDKDISPFLTKDTEIFFQRLGYIDGPFSYNGFPDNFVANANIRTQLGKLNTDINFNIDRSNNDNSVYSGRLSTTDFYLGKLLDNEKLGKISMNGTIKGMGFDVDELTLHTVASISSIEYNQYAYKNIQTDAIIKKSLFNGHLDIKDSNLVLVADGTLDYRQPEKIMNVKVQCTKAELKPLNLELFDKDVLIRTNLFMDFKGMGIDDAVGNGYITDSYLLYDDNKEIFIDTLHLLSRIDNDSSRTIQLNSTIITASLTGDFKPTIIAHDFTEFVQEVSSSVFKDSIAVINYYAEKTDHKEHRYNASVDIDIHDINAFLNIYTPGLYISGNSNIKGRFTSGSTKTMRARSYIDTLYYNGLEFQKNKFNLFCSQENNKPDVLGSLSWISENQVYDRYTDTENLNVEMVLFKERVTFYAGAKQTKSTNYSRITGTIDLFEPYNIVSIDNSFIHIQNKTWTFEDNRKIYFNNNTIKVDSISIYNNNERITLQGSRTDGVLKGSIEMNQISLSDFTHLFTDYKFTGIVNGGINLGKTEINSNVTISDFGVDTIYIGNVNGEATWDNINQLMNVDVNIYRQSSNIFELTGYYVPEGSNQNESMNLQAEFKDADISSINSITKGVFTHVSGFATGNLKITGTIGEPVVKGEAFIRRGHFTIPYLGTTYTFSDYIRMENDRIGFDNLELKDMYNNTCYVSGGLNHDHFSNFVLDIKGHIPEKNENFFQAMNLTEKQNNYYYGEAYVTGHWNIIGPFNKIKVSATAKSQANTKIYIPLNTYEGVNQQSYIKFVDDSTKSAVISEKKKIDLSGVELDLNFIITRDAYSEIIFDKKAGDIIRGNGEGNMKLTIDTRGDFNMFGNYRITEGKYNFTMAGIINKEFTIDPGSSITWNGNPYEGILDIQTRYRVYTSLKPILISLDSSQLNSSDAQRKYPVNVLMNLKGNLLNPEIGLNLQIEKKYPGQFSGDVTSFESYVAANPSEMNKQAFSVIVLRKLSPIGSFTGISGSYANLSELLSNQLSSFLSQVDENLEINVDLSNLDKNGLNTFNMRFSYTALDGRLRISRDGGYHYGNSSSAATNIVGEWTVEYMLTPNGNLRAKVYNKINQNALITSTSSNSTMATGFSLMHTQGFDSLSDLFKRKKKKQKKNKQAGAFLLRKEEEILPV